MRQLAINLAILPLVISQNLDYIWRDSDDYEDIKKVLRMAEQLPEEDLKKVLSRSINSLYIENKWVLQRNIIKLKSKFVFKTKFIKLLSCGLLENFEEKLEIYYQAIEGDEDRPVTGNCLEALREGCYKQNII